MTYHPFIALTATCADDIIIIYIYIKKEFSTFKEVLLLAQRLFRELMNWGQDHT